ncbi:MAG: radical SAM family heme chaperone HemW [Pseudomonadota bacterium]
MTLIDDGTPGFGVYVHWPFCAAKCPYCDFNSHVRHSPVDQEAFVKSYLAEIKAVYALTGPRQVTSVFFGGGTPSLMAPETLDAILQAIDQAWGLPAGIEISMEANPASSDAERFKAYAMAGVNRASLGVQALNDDDLRFLGRLHTVDEALRAIDLARSSFGRMSFDLIYARPGQTAAQWEAELRRAIGYAADHLSLYQLTIEDGTPFKSLHETGQLVLPDDDLAADLYALTQSVTAELGLPVYEISNHAAPGARSRHNLTYWRYGDYAGIGPGAHGRLTLENGAKIATVAKRHPESWADLVGQQGQGMTTQTMLTTREQADEMLVMGLRLTEGFDLARFETLAGRPIADEKLQAMIDLGMVVRLGNARIAATDKGRIVLNAVLAELAL